MTEKLILQSIRKEGGTTASYYYRLIEEINNINENIYDIVVGLNLNISKELYIKAGEFGYFVLSKPYQEANLKDITNITAEKKRLSIIFKKTINEIVDKSLKGMPIWHTPLVHKFTDAIYLDMDKNGLCINNQAFLDILDNIGKAHKNKMYKKHQIAVNAINELFKYIPNSWEEMQKYFEIKNGQIRISNEAENKNLYRRLI